MPGTAQSFERLGGGSRRGPSTRPFFRSMHGTPPLVGRKNELLTLRHAVAEAKRGHGSIVGISGEAGIGKTRLATHLMAVERHACTCLTGRAYLSEGRVPFAVWVDALEPFVSGLAPDHARAMLGSHGILQRLFPSAIAMPDALPSFESTEQGKMLLFVAFRELLQRAAEKRPLILYLDDLHAADQASLELLHFITRSISSLAMLIVITYRDGEPQAPEFSAVIDSLMGNGLLTPVRLSALDYGETEELVSVIVGGYVSPSVVSALHERTAGNPLFLHEVLRPMPVSGSASYSGVPQTIAQLVRSRLSKLHPEARSVLTFAAVAGESTSFALLQHVAGLRQDALVAALDELLAQQCLSEQMERGNLHYSFPHPLIREVIYGQLSEARRASLHDAIGHALQRPDLGEPVDATELAHHLSHSLRRETRRLSLPHLLSAAARALDVFAHGEALEALERASAIVEEDDPSALRYEIFEHLGRAREWSGQFEHAIAAYEKAFICTEDVEAKAALHRRTGRCFWQIGDEIRAMAHLEQGLELLSGGTPSVEAVSLLQEMAQARQRLGEADRAIADNLRSVHLAEQLDNAQSIARGCLGLLTTYAVMGDMDRGGEYGRRAVELCADPSMAPLAWQVHSTLGALLRHRGLHAQAAEHLHQSLRIADELGAPALESWPLTTLSEQCRLAGDLANAVRFGERAVEIDRSYGQDGLLPRSLAYAALAQRLLGNRAPAADYIAAALEILRRHKKEEIRISTPAMGIDALLSHLNGDLEEAARKAAYLVDYLDAHGRPVLYLLYPLALPLRVELAIRASDDTTIDADIERLRAMSTHAKHAPAQAAYHHLVALRALQRGVAERHAFDEALERYRSMGLRYDLARVLLDKAQLLLSIDRNAALRVLDEGLRLTGEMSAQPLQEGFVGLSRAAGVRRNQARRASDGLTERESEVAELVRRGLTNKQVAAELHISLLTVETHVRNILRKTGARSRSHLGEVLG